MSKTGHKVITPRNLHRAFKQFGTVSQSMKPDVKLLSSGKEHSKSIT